MGRFKLAVIPIILGLVLGTGCDSGPEPPEEECTPTTSTNGPVGEWEYLGLGGEKINDITAIAVNPCDPQVIYAGSMFNFSDGIQGRLFKSTDGGQTWDTLRVGGDFHEIIIPRSNPDVIYVAHSGTGGRAGAGVLRSADDGRTWQVMNEGLELEETPATGVYDLAVRPDHPNVLYASTISVQLGGWFYRSTDGGQHWSAVERTETSRLLTGGVRSIVFDSSNPSTMYVATGMSGYILKSTNGGSDWQLTGWNPPEQPREERYGSAYDLHVVSGTDTMYAAASPGFTPHGVYRSIDGGANWKPFTKGLPDSSTAVQLTGGPEKGLYVVATSGDTGGIYELDDTQAVWTRVGIKALRQPYYYSDIVYSKTGKTLYFGSDGIFRLRLE